MDTARPPSPAPLHASQLRRNFAGPQLNFETTASIENLAAPLGQTRAADAIQLAIAMMREGYNLFVMGPPGSGKRTMVMQVLAQRSAQARAPATGFMSTISMRLPSLLRSNIPQVTDRS